MSKKKTNGMAPFMFIGGALIITLGIWLLIENIEDKNFEGEEARGTIVRYEVDDSGKRSAIIEFYSKDSIKYQFKDSESRLVTRQKKELDLIYQPSNPNKAIVYDPYDIWGIPLSVAIIGLFIMIFGLVIRLIGF